MNSRGSKSSNASPDVATISATEAETHTPRIAYDDLPEQLKTKLAARVERLGYLGEFFQVGANQPEALAGFVDYTEALKQALPDRLVEVISLTMSTATGNDYERVQHERLSLKIGMSEREVLALVAGTASSEDGFDELELAAVELCRDVVVAAGASCAASYEVVLRLAGPEIAVGCLMTASRYLAHATMVNTWGIGPPVSSPFSTEASDA